MHSFVWWFLLIEMMADKTVIVARFVLYTHMSPELTWDLSWIMSLDDGVFISRNHLTPLGDCYIALLKDV